MGASRRIVLESHTNTVATAYFLSGTTGAMSLAGPSYCPGNSADLGNGRVPNIL
jgi:hypothetical protein